jgi:hypothetical protein
VGLFPRLGEYFNVGSESGKRQNSAFRHLQNIVVFDCRCRGLLVLALACAALRFGLLLSALSRPTHMYTPSSFRWTKLQSLEGLSDSEPALRWGLAGRISGACAVVRTGRLGGPRGASAASRLLHADPRRNPQFPIWPGNGEGIPPFPGSPGRRAGDLGRGSDFANDNAACARSEVACQAPLMRPLI